MADRNYIGLNSKTVRTTALPLTAGYFVLHYLQFSGAGPEWLRFYGKDILLVPILITATSLTGEMLGKPQRIGWREVLLTWIVVSVFFELFLPAFREDIKGDPLDIAAYAFGAAVFLFFLRQNNELRHSV